MTADATIQSWLTGALDAWDTFEKLLTSQKYAHALFFLHLSLEKLLKALIIQKRGEPPPPVHDLVRLAQAANITLDDQMVSQLAEISTFNVAARYDDEKLQFYKKATADYAAQWQTAGRALFEKFRHML